MNTAQSVDIEVLGSDSTEDLPRGTQTLLNPYINPEFFTPKEISSMVAGFTMQAYLAMLGKSSQIKIESAMDVAVDIVSFAINNDFIGGVFERRSRVRSLTYDPLIDSRVRMAEAAKTAEIGFGV